MENCFYCDQPISKEDAIRKGEVYFCSIECHDSVLYGATMYESLSPIPFVCEKEECTELATTEWYSTDEDNDGYYSYRCDNHPMNNSEYEARGI